MTPHFIALVARREHCADDAAGRRADHQGSRRPGDSRSDPGSARGQATRRDSRRVKRSSRLAKRSSRSAKRSSKCARRSSRCSRRSSSFVTRGPATSAARPIRRSWERRRRSTPRRPSFSAVQSDVHVGAEDLDGPAAQLPPDADDPAAGSGHRDRLLRHLAVIVVGWPISRALGRRLERRVRVSDRATRNVSEQLQRIEQAVEAVAIEVERISEGQRFLAKIQEKSPSTVE